MSIEDPYFVVRDEVNAAEAACAKKLIRWRALMQVTLKTSKYHMKILVHFPNSDLNRCDDSILKSYEMKKNAPAKFRICRN